MPKDVAHPSEPLDFGLVYVNADDPGLTRRGGPSGFRYMDAKGEPVTDRPTLARIEALVIPPAWTEVWICPSGRGHIQAVGRDQRGRRQYRYHDKWRIARDLAKFERLTAFGRALPRLRRRVEADLGRRGLPREKVLAAVVRLLETTLIRVGNDEYARTNKSYGLTTLRNRHASISSRGAVFRFRGKGGKDHETGFQDRRLARVVKSCQELPGQRLFQYLDEDGVRHAVESADVNAYLREATGLDISAKDFRTWAATVSAARALAGSRAGSASEGKRTVATCVKAVSALLGNTPAVCRRAYIHPWVLEAFEAGALPLRATGDQRRFELAVIRFLEAAPTPDDPRRG
ncbi:MAG: DNA topoisomerase IB [Phenylobacterium sp.]|uniref:DNA topoisomerase IB n=1 Tax=Phenylobacterium sp. TaxID=1871053 RepID=UPI002718DD12|nr:DNA topoisomerase IB [Phenylobacterium sp.]MDO8900292.1 DNA topoisomerase IB [Phenylobacterium sp.]